MAMQAGGVWCYLKRMVQFLVSKCSICELNWLRKGMLHSKPNPPIQHASRLTHTSPRLVRKITSPWLPLRCLWPSLLGMRMGVATSKEPTSEVRPKLLEKSPCWNKLKGEWWHIEALKSCSRTGTPDVATAQQGRSTSMEPLITVCSAPFPPTTYREVNFFV